MMKSKISIPKKRAIDIKIRDRLTIRDKDIRKEHVLSLWPPTLRFSAPFQFPLVFSWSSQFSLSLILFLFLSSFLCSLESLYVHASILRLTFFEKCSSFMRSFKLFILFFQILYFWGILMVRDWSPSIFSQNSKKPLCRRNFRVSAFWDWRQNAEWG